MKKQEILKLRFRRQYLLSPKEVDCPFQHTKHNIAENYFLYTHTDLNNCRVSSDKHELFILGDIFDFQHTEKTNLDILRGLVDLELDEFLEEINRFAGRFVLLFIQDKTVILIHDAAAARKIFYQNTHEGSFCASQPHLLAKVTNQAITKDPSKLKYYDSEEFKILSNANIGNTTCYDSIFQLIPNHYLDLNACEVKRYWPNKKIVMLPYQEVVDECSAMLKGYLESMAKRYKLMLPVTGGKDSRLLMAATKDIKEQVFYYINHLKTLTLQHHDIRLPRKLFKKLGLNYHILDPYNEIDEDFKSVYFENNPMASESSLDVIYNYYLFHQDKINLPGTFINVVEDIYEFGVNEISPERMAKMIHTDRFDYAIQYYSEWFNGAKQSCEQSNMDILTLLYWEERCGNWATQTQLDKDIAQEDIIPFNSRLLIEKLLSIDLKYREKPDFPVFKKLIKELWPALLQVNTNQYFKARFLDFSKKIGVFYLVKKIYYTFYSK